MFGHAVIAWCVPFVGRGALSDLKGDVLKKNFYGVNLSLYLTGTM